MTLFWLFGFYLLRVHLLLLHHRASWPRIASLPPVLLDPAAVALGDEPLPAPGGHLAHELVGDETGSAAADHKPLEDATAKVRRSIKCLMIATCYC